MISGISSGSILMDYRTILKDKKVSQATESKDSFASLIKRESSNFPYGAMAKNGVIEYNGVVFVGDAENNSINLGDVSDKRHVLRIHLSGGGTLNVNYDNIGDLKNAIGMFSGKDQGIIMKAIASHHFLQGVVKEAEDEEEKAIESMKEQETEELRMEL